MRKTLRATGWDWYKADEGRWPVLPGEYDVKLMLDDGFTELAATKLKVVPFRRSEPNSSS
jgi:hypothetical protein